MWVRKRFLRGISTHEMSMAKRGEAGTYCGYLPEVRRNTGTGIFVLVS